MSMWSLICQQNVFKCYHYGKRFKEFYLQDGGKNQLWDKITSLSPYVYGIWVPVAVRLWTAISVYFTLYFTCTAMRRTATAAAAEHVIWTRRVMLKMIPVDDILTDLCLKSTCHHRQLQPIALWRSCNINNTHIIYLIPSSPISQSINQSIIV